MKLYTAEVLRLVFTISVKGYCTNFPAFECRKPGGAAWLFQKGAKSGKIGQKIAAAGFGPAAGLRPGKR
jgi:hypothetical protein